MGLSIVDNVSSLTAQNNMQKTSGMLSKSLERLSSGLKINRGADGPAALVISEQQRAQISGIRTAIDNTNKAVAMVQTGEGALNEINRLLVKVRSLALDSANSGVNDSNALAANQSEISNALSSIDRISGSTQFGTKKLLDGTAGMTGVASDADVTVLKASGDATAGSYAVAVTTAASKATVSTGVAQTANLAADETLTLNGVSIKLTSGMSQQQVVDTVNSYKNQTGVAADVNGGNTRLISTSYGSAARISVQSSVAPAGGDDSGFSNTLTNAVGTDVQGTIGSDAASGVGNVLTVSTGTGKGVSVSFAGADAVNSVNGANGNVTVTDNSLVFQIGANYGQTSKVALDKSDTGALGMSVTNSSGFANLSAIDVRTSQGAQDSLKVIDQAISDVSNQRGKLGAFQANTLESNANNLRTTLENTVAAESVVRDTDFAQEIAEFTKNQVMMQAGQTVLGNANQLPQMVASLLRG